MILKMLHHRYTLIINEDRITLYRKSLADITFTEVKSCTI